MSVKHVGAVLNYVTEILFGLFSLYFRKFPVRYVLRAAIEFEAFTVFHFGLAYNPYPFFVSPGRNDFELFGKRPTRFLKLS
jgi:hypothetical protein